MKRYDGHPYENGDILHYKVRGAICGSHTLS